MDKPKHPTDDPSLDLTAYDPEPGDDVRVGESPVPGLTLKRILCGHQDRIVRIAWSSDGQYLASPSFDQTIRIWDVKNGVLKTTLQQRIAIGCVAWNPNGLLLASGSADNGVYVWDHEAGKIIYDFSEHTDLIRDVSWSPNGQLLASSSDDSTIKLWDIQIGASVKTITDFDRIPCLSWSPEGDILASGSDDGTITLWNPETGTALRKLRGHFSHVLDISWSPDGKTLASASWDKTIRIWNTETGSQIKIIEAHLGPLLSVSFSFDGRILASKSIDNSIRFWRCDSWESISVLEEEAYQGIKLWHSNLAFHPKSLLLASLFQNDTCIHIWNINDNLLEFQVEKPIHYVTTKIVLLGDSGVGKTGLGWRLAHEEFKDHTSTHGQQFWVIDALGKKREDGTECEAVLWDLAGQHVYRPIHAIFLDNVDASLVLFDPTNRQEPLKGVQFWLEQLKGKTKLPPSILVGARSDRGASVLSQQELDQFCQRYGVSGGYVSTSAKSGDGLEQLLSILREQIPWDETTTTVTTRTFKRIKDFVLTLKEKTEQKNILVSPAELRQQLQATDESWQFSDAEMMTATGHLETHGYVTILKSSSGDQFILLKPDLLVTLASSVLLLADKNPRELGAVNESELLQGVNAYEELQGLAEAEQQILLDAAILRFLEHNICFRERLDESALLIFPGLIKQKRPLQDNIPSTDDISYIVRGRVENIYATLVVLLGYTPSFSRINQWQNQAQYETETGFICGFRLVEDREGEIELILYYSNEMPVEERLEFQGLFERFLYQRDVQVTPFPPVLCPKGHIQERTVVVKRQQSGKKFLFCDECGEKTALPNIAEAQTIGLSAAPWLQREEAMARLRSAYEANLSRIKGYRRGWAAPRYYLSHLPEQEKWAAKLRHDLSDAGMYLIEEAARVGEADFVLILSTLTYKQTFRQEPQALQDDVNLIQNRFANNNHNLIALVLAGSSTKPHDIKACQPGNFCDETHYSISLFDLVLDLYHIPRTSTGFAPLRQALHEQWERTLMSQQGASLPEIDLPKLRQLLDKKLNTEELKSVCFGIIDFDNLPGETKSNKLAEMLAHFERRGEIGVLMEKIEQERPDIDLNHVYK